MLTAEQSLSFPSPRIDIMGLGDGLTDEQIEAMGKELAAKTNDFISRISSYELGTLLAQYDADTRNRIAAAIIGNGGDTSTVTTALRYASEDLAPSPIAKIRHKGLVAGLWGVLSTASMAASAYHGYKRNESVGWALVWGLFGAMFPIITPAIALAEGFGKPKHGRAVAGWEGGLGLSMRDFIKENRTEIDEHIKAACSNCRLNNSEREDWIRNDEVLYFWARRSGVKV